jgi:Cu-Zn family superoxide dismutase
MRQFKKLPLFIFLAVVACLTFSCNNEANNTESGDSTTMMDSNAARDNTQQMDHMTDTATVAMVNSAKATISGTYADTVLNGTADFETMPDGKIKMTLDITVAAKANKTVAVHLHEHGDCGDNGKASHGHWNPTNAQHGKWESNSFHLGDIGNVKLDANGKGSITVTTGLWTLGGKPGTNILNKAMIVHGGTDDYTTQPTGDAGSRIGCGLIQGK